ncbi:Flavin-Reduct domain-containing protein [Mycena chlorophos]|uniref:Flavin-Reduct domain-containing protein n=1 Tax=Mycena chlorophos TaxID=658473 RepID=A0A8H6TKE9_MYCCL|nr:Flavin-Reduct domain-containing protein [Mycena chlorophos]
MTAFQPGGFKFTDSPDPAWTFGASSSTTHFGRQWAEQETQGWKTIDTSQEDPRYLYALSISGIVPRPIAFVSSISAKNEENLAPFSWFNQVCTNPPIISISCTGGSRQKDTARNILETKGFTVNIISEPWAVQANAACIDAPAEVNEWVVSGLTKEPSTSIAPARVKESAFSMECELLQHIEVKNAAGGLAANLILGTVKYIHVRNAVLDERGLVDPAKFMAVGRLGDVAYSKVGDGFRIPRPAWAEEKEKLQDQLGDVLWTTSGNIRSES